MASVYDSHIILHDSWPITEIVNICGHDRHRWSSCVCSYEVIYGPKLPAAIYAWLVYMFENRGHERVVQEVINEDKLEMLELFFF
jgi:hypothetical protein